jgi:hypothetical protein
MTIKIAKLKKKLAATKKLVEVNNAAFKAASPAEKRVMVAKDVLARIKTGQYNPTQSTWAELTGAFKNPEEASLQKQIVDEGEKCDCCGVGAITLSCIVFNNNATVDDIFHEKLDYWRIKKSRTDRFGLKKIFSPRQLALIEIAFEAGAGYFEEHTGRGLYTRAEFWKLAEKYQRYRSYDRLQIIMENIILNKGKFVIE